MIRRPLALTLTLGLALGAQEKGPLFPQLSPKASVSQIVGTTLVEITYHRPAVRGREIWGRLVPNGKIWRMGANEATTLRFSDPVQIHGHKVPAGTYALFAIPGPDAWTLILNKRAVQSGAYEYDAKQDLLRLDVKPKAVPHTEWLTYEVYPAGHGTAYVDLYWEKVRVGFLVEVDVDELVTARMRKAMKARPGDWKLLSDAAQYCAENEIHMGEALAWAERSIQLNPNPTNHWVKAQVLHVQGRKAEAMAWLDKGLALARQRKSPPAEVGPLEEFKRKWSNGNGR